MLCRWCGEEIRSVGTLWFVKPTLTRMDSVDYCSMSHNGLHAPKEN